jgi:hypothetical protein
VSPIAGLLAFVSYGLYVVLVFGVFSIPRFMDLLATGVSLEPGASLGVPALAGWTWAGYAIALPVALVITALSVVVPLTVAARRLDRVEV